MTDIKETDQQIEHQEAQPKPAFEPLFHSVTAVPADQDPDVEPDLSARAILVTAAAALSYVTTV